MRPTFAFQLSVVLVALSLTACFPSLPRHAATGGATYKAKVDIRIWGMKRTYLVHLPPGYSPERSFPLVVVIHGAFDTAKGMETFSGFSALADRENFIVIYPNGFGLMGFLQHWNAGHCCGKAAADGLDDVGFLEAVIADACARLAVDRSRIYMTGFSNGGMMTYRFAAEKGRLLAAIAPLAAAAGGRPDEKTPEWSLPRPVAPLPVLTMHGSADEHVPFMGGVSPKKNDSRTYWSAQQTLDVWIKRNGCNTKPLIREERKGHVRVTLWHESSDNADVILYELTDWDHRWPGLFFTAELPRENPLYGFDAAEIIWSFFRNHRRTAIDENRK